MEGVCGNICVVAAMANWFNDSAVTVLTIE